ncbi:COG1611 Predicted Rossmann fold nucleotide-binding protein [Burkholderiaceae bacterium]|jgi:uncharacterized protein (TIGR00730 family)
MGHKEEKVSPALQQTTQIMSEMLHAADTLAEIGPAISIFGSARIKKDSPYYALSEAIARGLANTGFTIIAGGGPGIMEAANKGAFEAGGTSVGLHIKLPKESKHNDFQTISLPFQHFVSRKATFFMNSLAYVVLPGGFGTLDELFEAVTLMQTGKIPPGPVILVGTEFWGGLMTWLRSQLEQTALINPLDRHTLIIEDDPNRVVQHLVDFYRDHPGILSRQPNAPV